MGRRGEAATKEGQGGVCYLNMARSASLKRITPAQPLALSFTSA